MEFRRLHYFLRGKGLLSARRGFLERYTQRAPRRLVSCIGFGDIDPCTVTTVTLKKSHPLERDNAARAEILSSQSTTLHILTRMSVCQERLSATIRQRL